MSSYIDKFQDADIREKWDNIRNQINNSDTSNYSVEFQSEFSRFVKVYNFLGILFNNIDPELLPKESISNLNSHIINLYSTLSNALNNGQLSSLNSANSFLDKILIALKPYSLYNEKLKKSLRAAISSYINEINKHLQQIPDIKQEYNKALEYREIIELYYNELFVGSDEEESIKNKITEELARINKQFSEIENIYSELLIDGDQISMHTEIRNAKDSIIEDKNTIKDLMVESSSKIEELNEFYVRIFGSIEENGERVGGLKQIIDDRIKQLDTYKKEQEIKLNELIENIRQKLASYEKQQQEKHIKLSEQIESLLPGATSAGLAKAYNDRREAYKMPIIGWNIIFILAMVSMVAAAYLNMENLTSWENTLRHILHYAPLYVPTVWLAIYASKRRSESRALEEEYAHKEALAKSYSSYKKQIEEIEGDDKLLMQKLLSKAIDTVSENPTKVLDRKHGDNIPSLDLVEKALNKVKSKK